MADFTAKALNEIRSLGATHIWYTGIIEHATQTDYRRYNISPDHPAVVKGKAGSPYAIKDYYDVDPDLAKDVPERMKEFENLVSRTHRAGLKVIIDFVPNHVARQYHSDAQPDGTTQLGANDDPHYAFSPYNNFYYIPQQELHGQFDMRGNAAEPYKEFPAKATGNNRFDAYPNINDWYETIKLNYGVDYANGGSCHFEPRPDTWSKMLQILLFWADKGIDGFRCDMAEMVPLNFGSGLFHKLKNNTLTCSLSPKSTIQTNIETTSSVVSSITCTTRWDSTTPCVPSLVTISRPALSLNLGKVWEVLRSTCSTSLRTTMSNA